MPIGQPADATVFKTLYLDCVPHAAIGGLLNWCDAAQTDFFVRCAGFSPEAARQAEWTVTRSNTLEYLVPLSSWQRYVSPKAFISVKTSLARIGKTSFALRFSIESEESVALARLESTMVAVDPQDFTKPVPVPNIDLFRQVLKPDAVPPVYAIEATPSERHRAAFCWDVEVRASDCDNLQHINNAIYGYLMEDTRRAAAEANALPEALARPSDAGGFPRAVRIDYLDQPQAGDVLSISLWPDEVDSSVLHFEFTLPLYPNGKVVCKASLMCGEHPAAGSNGGSSSHS
eukprot:CAMPEP_0206579944 /NCGR_PEP_ID=MMETSP0325_2-20121206/32854_1 /ASSEMBLY_ACC=CAM_ASM_000347 /TAXON_ID=2866 /ORGANISM="Crypthecodinium cohnii, Strain Seligo" /LENGTH=287 /DNA_ID=CAMNT_0054085859 /DNA_START=43 /DNA_END=903 /DNA_ORIENTATION=+